MRISPARNHHMEHAGRVIGRAKLIAPQDLAGAAWAATVGKKVANHTGRVSLVRSKMVIEVEDAIWQRQLYTMRGQIVAKLGSILGEGVVDDLEFRIMIPRIEPQREENPRSNDEADRIADPVLRNLYKTARRKASA